MSRALSSTQEQESVPGYSRAPIRIADIAWTALSVAAALWAILATVDAVRGTGSWAYSVVALALLTIGLTLRVIGIRRRGRTRL
ncbi:hypothetical protein [Streptomyces canus]|uniref:hypothetical protein n=1 Tax=Streptomyces canus TaxID=58343 RepID=UPI000361A35B|nr:hypothetical protein [Streptomyces canus]